MQDEDEGNRDSNQSNIIDTINYNHPYAAMLGGFLYKPIDNCFIQKIKRYLLGFFSYSLNPFVDSSAIH